jgi:hypothetical protein
MKILKARQEPEVASEKRKHTTSVTFLLRSNSPRANARSSFLDEISGISTHRAIVVSSLSLVTKLCSHLLWVALTISLHSPRARCRWTNCHRKKVRRGESNQAPYDRRIRWLRVPIHGSRHNLYVLDSPGPS